MAKSSLDPTDPLFGDRIAAARTGHRPPTVGSPAAGTGQGSPLPAGSLSVGSGAHDHTLGRPGAGGLAVPLFWLLVLAPAGLAGLAFEPWIGLALVPLQMLAAILVGSAVARHRRCGAMTLASMPLTALILLGVAASV
ncbi:hypothetical protein STVA_40740 [Allostella vacuolata]|nr:hypothetical protein STVA_40740 [Stella vacuolata]